MTDTRSHDAAESRRRIESGLAAHPHVLARVHRALLILLHDRGVITVDEIHARARAHEATPAPAEAVADNAPLSPRGDDRQRRQVQRIVWDEAARAFTPDEIEDVLNLALKREEARALEDIANLSTVSFELLAEKVRAFCELPRGQTRLPESEALAVRVALIRHFISDQLEFIGVAKRHLTIRDFGRLVGRVIGTDAGIGRIGGKAAGLFLAGRILDRARASDPDAPSIPIRTPESYFLRSDVIEHFLADVGLVELQSHKYRTIDEIHQEYPTILEVFRNAELPRRVVEHLGALLETIGEHPLIVRSSSLLEDRFGAAFAGKYRSVFLANQGDHATRLNELLGAIAEVYASTLHPDPISYRRKHGLLDYDENMAVLIQKVVGRRYRHYFLPAWAGVGLSLNEYRKNSRVRPEDGIARVVFGLGTRAVDRVANDWARVIPLGMPTLRPEVTAADIVRFSQREVDVLNLRERRFESLPLTELLEDELEFPGLDQAVSVLDHGFVRRPVGARVLENPEDLVVTFDRFTHDSPYPQFLRWILGHLERAYGCPVDIEFAHDGDDFYLLQCRPQVVRATENVRMPVDLPPDRVVFSARRDVENGSAHGIEVVVLIDPRDYDRIDSAERRLGVARVVRRLNERLHDRAFILMGPGRWGTRDPRMGIRVGYADINNTRMLIEIARPVGGFVPEASFGSHFFLDLVESRIGYLALYPEEEDNVFDEAFFHDSRNALPALLPDMADYADVVRVIEVGENRAGLRLNVDMDGVGGIALGYLAPALSP